MAGLVALTGAVLLYKGLAIDRFLSDTRDRIRDALYSGRVSVVICTVVTGLTIIGLFFDALAIRSPGVGGGEEVLIPSLLLVYHSAPWMALAALTASANRLLDGPIGSERVSTSYMSLPFGAVTVGLVVHGLAGFLLERQDKLANLELLGRLMLTPVQRLTVFIVAGAVVSAMGARVSASVPGEILENVADTSEENESQGFLSRVFVSSPSLI